MYGFVYAAVGSAVLFISFAAVLVRWSDATAGMIAFYRLGFTMLLLSLFLLAGKRIRWRNLSFRIWLLSCVSGLVLAMHFFFWFLSLERTSIASSVVLVTLSPIFTLAGSALFFRTRLTRMQIGGALLAVSGGMIIGWGDIAVGRQALVGDVLAFAAALLIAIYWLIGQTVRKEVDLFSYTFLAYGMSCGVLFVLNRSLHHSFYPYPPEEWLLFLLMAVFPMLLGHSVLNWSLKWVDASVVSVSLLGEAIGAALWGALFFGEAITGTQALGGTVILIGVFLHNRSRLRNET